MMAVNETARAEMKNLYEVKFNWNGEVHEFKTQAMSKDSAVRNGIRQLARVVGTSARAVRYHVLEGNRVEVRLFNN